jgi:hypothetical protein
MEYHGIIEKIEDGVAWGVFEDGTTFDLPANGHAIGDDIRLLWQDGEDEDCGYDHSLIIFGKMKATLFGTVLGDRGLEIVFMEEFQKNHN